MKGTLCWGVLGRYRVSEGNSPSLTRVRIFIFGLTAAIVWMIFPRSFIVMLYPRVRRCTRLFAFSCPCQQKFFDEAAATSIEKFKPELHLAQKVSNTAIFEP